MKRLILLSIALAASACTVQGRATTGPAAPQEPPPPPPPDDRPHEPHGRHHDHDHDRPRRPDAPPPPVQTPTPPPPVASYTPSGYEDRGTTMIGEVAVDARRGSLDIPVRSDAMPQRIFLVVEDGDLSLESLYVQYGGAGAKRDDLNVRHTFQNGARIRQVDLIGNRNPITRVEVRYRAVSGRPRLQLWFANKAPQVGPRANAWDKTGYVLLTKGELDPGKQNVLIASGDRTRVPTRLMLVIEGGEADILNLAIQYGDAARAGALGPKADKAVGQHLDANTPNFLVELPGNRNPIRTVDVTYKATSGRPQFQIWAAF